MTTTCTSPTAVRPVLGIGSLAASTALFLIGTAAPVAATIDGIALLVGQGLRYLVASAVLLAILAATGRLQHARPRRADLPRIAVLGAIGIAGFTSFFVTATSYADPALVGAVLSATPVLLAIVGPVMSKRRPAAKVIIGSIVIAGGTLLGTGSGSGGWIGILLCVGALGCEVGFSVFAVALIERYGPMITAGYASASGAIFLLVPALVINGPAGFARIGTNLGELPALGFLATVVSVGANLSWYTALRRLGTDRAGLFYAWTPIGALVTGLLLGSSSPTRSELAGVGVVIIGLLVGLVNGRRPTRPHRTELPATRAVRGRRSGRPDAAAGLGAGTHRGRARSSRRSGRC